MNRSKRYIVDLKLQAALIALLGLIVSFGVHTDVNAASHREAPITALDHKADITDWFSFRSYETGKEDTVTLILAVDPLLEPSNGPNYFPFDPEIVYGMNIDNDHDAVTDIRFEFRFETEIRLPGVFTSFVGAGGGLDAPDNAPEPAAPNPIVPPAITSLTGPGSVGLSLRQSYTVAMVIDGVSTPLVKSTGGKLFAVPSNVGPLTMPNYTALANQGIFTLNNGIRIFAGTTDDPFYIDLGAVFDSLNLRAPILTDAEDSDDTQNVFPACDAIAGFNVNIIAIEVPIEFLTSDGQIHDEDDPAAVIGSYGVTSRARTRVYNDPGEPATTTGDLVKIQRMGNALFNELIIGTGSKDLWSMSAPVDDEQFADFALDPVLARVLNAAFGVSVPDAPRLDLLPLVLYMAPVAPDDTPAGPIADLLRLNTGVMPTAPESASRLGLLGGDPAGNPNGRRVFDDVTDIATRIVAGVLNPDFNVFPNNRLADGINTNDRTYQNVFPYVAFANSGRDGAHNSPIELAPGMFGCLSTQFANGGGSGGGSGCSLALAGVSTGSLAGSYAALLLIPIFVLGRRAVSRKMKNS